MKGIIIYKGKYGATEQYVNWLSEELQLPAVLPDDIEPEKILEFDFIILAGSVYFGNWSLRDWTRQYKSLLQNKKLYFLVVCATPSSEKEKQQQITHSSFPPSLAKQAEVFFLPGRLVIENLLWRHRMALKIASRMEKDPKKKKAYITNFDGVKRENLNTIIASIRTLTHDEYAAVAVSY